MHTIQAQLTQQSRAKPSLPGGLTPAGLLLECDRLSSLSQQLTLLLRTSTSGRLQTFQKVDSILHLTRQVLAQLEHMALSVFGVVIENPASEYLAPASGFAAAAAAAGDTEGFGPAYRPAFGNGGGEWQASGSLTRLPPESVPTPPRPPAQTSGPRSGYYQSRAYRNALYRNNGVMSDDEVGYGELDDLDDLDVPAAYAPYPLRPASRGPLTGVFSASRPNATYAVAAPLTPGRRPAGRIDAVAVLQGINAMNDENSTPLLNKALTALPADIPNNVP